MLQKLVIAIFMLATLSACGGISLPSDAKIAEVISRSEGYSKHKEAFMTATKTLLKNGTCKLDDFERLGGWMKSTAEYQSKPVYHAYCGVMHRSNRIYLNTETGEIFH